MRGRRWCISTLNEPGVLLLCVRSPASSSSSSGRARDVDRRDLFLCVFECRSLTLPTFFSICMMFHVFLPAPTPPCSRITQTTTTIFSSRSSNDYHHRSEQ
jgi:hypothetical protein